MALVRSGTRGLGSLWGGVSHQQGGAGAQNPEAATSHRKGISGKTQLTVDVSLSIGIGGSP